MSLAKRAGDLFYTFRFLRLLTTPFEETDAFKLGLIDEKGNRIRSERLDNSEKKAAYTTFHRLVFNIKKIMAKVPFGSSKLASYAAALFLIKEQHNLSDKSIERILRESELDTLDFLAEKSEWFLLDDKRLSPGVYKLQTEHVLIGAPDATAFPRDKIRINDNCYPVGEMLGLDIYEGEHINTGLPVYITTSEISR